MLLLAGDFFKLYGIYFSTHTQKLYGYKKFLKNQILRYICVYLNFLTISFFKL